MTATAVAGYLVYWTAMAHSIERSFHGEVERIRAAGVAVAYTSWDLGGFPTHFRSTLVQPRADNIEDDWRYWGDAIPAEAPAWHPNNVSYRLLGRYRVQATNTPGKLNFIAEGGSGKFALDDSGRMIDGALVLERIALEMSELAGMITAERLASLVSRPADVVADPNSRETLTAHIGLRGVTVPVGEENPLGSHMDFLDLDTRHHGAAWDGWARSSLAAWRDSGGTVKVRDLALRWGRLEAKGDGYVTLDPVLRPIGELSLRVIGVETIVDMLIDDGRLELGAGTIAKLGLLVLAKSQSDGAVPIPLTAQDGQIFLNGFAMGQLAPLIAE